MTPRAVILGLLGAAAVCGFTFFNDSVMHQTMFVGNNMPISVYGGLMLFLLVSLPKSKGLPIPPMAVAGLVSGVAAAPVAGLAAGLAHGPTSGLVTALVVCVLVGLAAAAVFAFVPRGLGAYGRMGVGAVVGGLVAGGASAMLCSHGETASVSAVLHTHGQTKV